MALQEYLEGNYDNIEILKSSTKRAIEIHGSYLPKECLIMFYFESTLEQFNNPPNIIELRELIAEFYQTHVLGTTYVISPSELGVCKNGFLGLFHVHDDGSKPSNFDLKSNQKTHLLDLVISAKSDYKETGVSLYLIYAGNYEVVYEGLLEHLEKPIDR